MAKAEGARTGLRAGAQSENAQQPHLARDLEAIAAELRQLRGISFAHRELMRHLLDEAPRSCSDEVDSSYHLCRLSEGWLQDLDDQLDAAIHKAMRLENAHG